MIKKSGIIFIVAIFFISMTSITVLSQHLYPPTWDSYAYYIMEDRVTYQGNVYEMINASFEGEGDINWNPEVAVSQWELIGTTADYGIIDLDIDGTANIGEDLNIAGSTSIDSDLSVNGIIYGNITLTSEQLIALKGESGKNGLDGKPGENGLDGKPGENGLDGKPGENGLDGKPGKDGNNGNNLWEKGSGYNIYRNQGNVGIGITHPSSKLEVQGSWNNIIKLNSGSDDGGRLYATYENVSPYLNFIEYDDPFVFNFKQTRYGNNVKMGFHRGNVGIGTIHPSSKLEVQGSWNNIIKLNSGSDDGGRLYATYENFSPYLNFIEYDDPFVFNFKQTRYGSNIKIGFHRGNVGIGTIHPSSKLEVQGSWNNIIKLNSGSDDGGRLYATYENFSPYLNFIEYDDPFVFNFKQTRYGSNIKIGFHRGNVGIGTTHPSYKLDVRGTIRGYNVSPSDVRWKTNIHTIENSLEKISKIRGVSYEWKEPLKGTGKQIGLIAQEVEKVFPEVVSADNKGYKSVAYAQLVGPLVEAVKELKKENDRLKQDNKNIKKELDRLRIKIENRK